MRERGLATEYRAHHQGYFYQLLRGKKQVTTEMIDRWFSDEDHGFLHSYFVAFQAFNLKYGEIPENVITDLLEHHAEPSEDEVLLASCLLHDVAKTVQIEEEGHDTRLHEFFTGLDEAAYTHYTSPIPEHPLVRGDRLELLRYPDLDTWIDYSKLDPIDELQSYFYRKFRPALIDLLNQQHENFIRHGIEKLEGYNPEYKYYPQESGSWMFEGDGFYWAVDTGISPVGKCITAHKKYYDKYLEPLGIMSMYDLQKYRPTFEPAGSMKGCTGKDHLVVKTERPIPVNDWSFLYDARRGGIEQFEWLFQKAKIFVPYHLLKEIIEIQELLHTNWKLLCH